MLAIISAVEDKVLLTRIMVQYFKMMTQYDFYKNKIVLIPQRVFALCVFKYFDFKISEIDPEKLRSILNLSQ